MLYYGYNARGVFIFKRPLAGKEIANEQIQRKEQGIHHAIHEREP